MVTDDIDQARIAVGKSDNLAYGAGTEQFFVAASHLEAEFYVFVHFLAW